MATNRRAQHILQALLLGSLGLLMAELLQPVDVYAQSCTIDPLGGEVCLPEEEPEDPEDPDDDEVPDDSKKSKSSRKQRPAVIIPQCFGPCT